MMTMSLADLRRFDRDLSRSQVFLVTAQVASGQKPLDTEWSM
jgi:hypothetical protein